MCLPWSETPTSTCSGAGDYKALDRKMRTSDTSNCLALCQQEQQIGCCYLSNKYGCHWKAGAKSTTGGSAMTTTCYPGKFKLNEV